MKRILISIIFVVVIFASNGICDDKTVDPVESDHKIITRSTNQLTQDTHSIISKDNKNSDQTNKEDNLDKLVKEEIITPTVEIYIKANQ